MARKDQIARLADMLAFTTGSSHQQARQHIDTLHPEQPLIPEADFQQALLEHQVFAGLAWTPRTKLHPWGITKVTAAATHLELQVEPTKDMATDIAELLPCTREGGLHGVSGGRLLSAGDSGITIGVLDTNASVTFTGITRTLWDHALAAVEAEADQSGDTLPYREAPSSWTVDEIDDLPPYRDNTTFGRMSAETAWLISGLLRRIRLVRMIGVVLHTSAWANPARGGGEHWILDLQHDIPDDPEHHDRLVHALTHPRLGIPLAPIDSHCTCGTPWSHACQTDLAATDGRLGRLQLRFNRAEDWQRKLWAQERTRNLATRKALYEEVRLPALLRHIHAERKPAPFNRVSLGGR